MSVTCQKLSCQNLFLYTDDSCLACHHENINKNQKHLNEDFSHICDWFVDNKLGTQQYFLLLNLKGKVLKNLT